MKLLRQLRHLSAQRLLASARVTNGRRHTIVDLLVQKGRFLLSRLA